MRDTTIESTIACKPALFACPKLFAPIYLAISEFAPEPIPFPSPTRTMKSGVMNPIAANASEPIPATHMLSARLYIMIKSIETIIGTLSFLIALFGSPVITSIFSFFSLFSLINPFPLNHNIF